jgi:hypothetical protein
MSIKIFDRIEAVSASKPATLPASIERLLASAALTHVPRGKFPIAVVDAAFKRAGMSIADRMAAKDALHRAHLID